MGHTALLISGAANQFATGVSEVSDLPVLYRKHGTFGKYIWSPQNAWTAWNGPKYLRISFRSHYFLSCSQGDDLNKTKPQTKWSGVRSSPCAVGKAPRPRRTWHR